jgi:gas vesicle protein
MARRRTTPKELPDAVREAVERTVQATVGSPERTRDTVDELVRGSRRAVAEAIDERRPATHEDIRELKSELRAIARRLEAIEKRLPAKRK